MHACIHHTTISSDANNVSPISNVMALYYIKSSDQGKFVDESGLPFNAGDYSMLKYGSKSVAHQYARNLATKFASEIASWTNGNEKQIYVTSSPWKMAPTAAWCVAQYFVQELNEKLKHLRVNPAILSKLERKHVFEGDYGKLNHKDRQDMMAQNPVNLPAHVDFKDSVVIAIDDVRVTGAHERLVQQALWAAQPARICHLYVTILEQHSNPALESVLNQFLIKSLSDVQLLIVTLKDNFHLNARTCKYILGQSDLLAVEQFFVSIPRQLVLKMFQYIVDDGYHTIKGYEQQWEILQRITNTIMTISSPSTARRGRRNSETYTILPATADYEARTAARKLKSRSSSAPDDGAAKNSYSGFMKVFAEEVQ